MLAPVGRPPKRRKNAIAHMQDWSDEKKLRSPGYYAEYSYILDISKLQQLVSDYFTREKVIKLIDVDRLVLMINVVFDHRFKTRRIWTTGGASTSNGTKENEESMSTRTPKLSRSYFDDLTDLAIECEHYPTCSNEITLTDVQKEAVARGVNRILGSRVNFDPFVRELIKLDAGHFAFDLLFPKKKRKQVRSLNSTAGNSSDQVSIEGEKNQP